MDLRINPIIHRSVVYGKQKQSGQDETGNKGKAQAQFIQYFLPQLGRSSKDHGGHWSNSFLCLHELNDETWNQASQKGTTLYRANVWNNEENG